MWLLPPIGGEAIHVIKMSEWVNDGYEKIPNFTRSWPDVTYRLFRSIFVNRSSHQRLLGAAYTNGRTKPLKQIILCLKKISSSVFAVTLQKTINISQSFQDGAWLKTKLFFAEVSFGRDRCLMKTLRKTIFLLNLILLLWRESVLPFESASYA